MTLDAAPPPGRSRAVALPGAGILDVWILDVTAPWYDALADADLVSERERARADSFTHERLARALLARRSALRCVLGRYLRRDPASVDVVTAPGGKPVLLPRTVSGGRPGVVASDAPTDAGSSTPHSAPEERGTLAFSVGHSGDLCGIAVGTSSSVGFDIERRRSVPRAEAIARRWFGVSEARLLDGLDDEAMEREFMRLWTAKEALAKRHGAGLRLMMRGGATELDTRTAESEGRLRWLSPRPGYHAAVASTAVVEHVAIIEPRDDSWI